MTTVETITREMDPQPRLTPMVRTAKIVVATDGSDAALAAFNAANLICARNGAEVRVLSVLEPMSMLFPPTEAMLLPPDFDRARQDAQNEIVRDQIGRFDRAGQWSTELRTGRPAEVIAAFASEHHADLIVVGANRHGVWGRILGEETALELARLTDTPLLIASPGTNHLPRRVVIAMDLQPEGLRDAARALAAFADVSAVSCVHVKPEPAEIPWVHVDHDYGTAISARFSALEEALGTVGPRPDLVLLSGEPARELTEFAEYSRSDLIVTGLKRSHGRARALSGRTASRIIRQAGCSVLILPNEVTAEGTEDVRETTNVVQDPGLWNAVLREFTARNSGRIVNLEVDHPEIGAMVEASRYPLLGVDYDHRDGRVTITLGYTHGVDRHLTHSMKNPDAVSVLRVNGRDTALSVTHGGGQTLLTL